MNILVTGKGGKSGAWKVRGQQLGAAIGATVLPMAWAGDIAAADIVIAVKRVPLSLLQSRRPYVLDIVDSWPQPKQGGMGEHEAVAWLRAKLQELRPAAVVFGTDRMREDSGFKGPSLVLPHHSWDRYVDRQPEFREQISVVGYEGGAHYLGRWQGVIERQCAARGWQFQLNGDMTQADIGIALRDIGGYPARWWKPGTKLSNLHALGIPALCSREAGYESVACGAEHWVESEADIAAAFDRLTDAEYRRDVREQMRAAMLPIDRIAEQYRAWLQTL